MFETLNPTLYRFYLAPKMLNFITLLMLRLYTQPHTLFGSRWSGVTTRNVDGTYYMSKLSRSFFCYLLNLRLKRDDPTNILRIEGSIDLKLLALEYRTESLQILEDLEKPHLDFNHQVMDVLMLELNQDLGYAARLIKQGFDRRYENLLLDGETDDIVFENIAWSDPWLPALLMAEKDVLLQTLLHPPSKFLTLRFTEPTRCFRCRSPLNLIDVQTERNICSNQNCCQNSVRRRHDIRYLPNNTEQMQFHNVEALSDVQGRTWANMLLMPLMAQDNNLEEEVESRFNFENRLVWRGSLRNKILRSNLKYLPYNYASRILHAMQFENRVALQITPVDWLEGPQNLGVIATQTIQKNTVVAVYSGQVFLASQDRYWVHNSSMVNLGWIGNDEVFIRPEQSANVGRYLNGSNDENGANIKTQWILIERTPPIVPRRHGELELVLVMISTKRIRPGTQLLWHYGAAYNNAYFK